MGAYLSSPVKSKLSEKGENENLAYGATAMQGWRVNQEVRLKLKKSFSVHVLLYFR